ncbi:MAG: hypothetical protein K0R18_451 [Bacillales bacterium]|jgi:hypothetical protein|nr:hypothetical protein [Bacillales bacterium]
MEFLEFIVNEQDSIGSIAKITMPNGDVLVDTETVDTYVFHQLEDYLYKEGFKIEFEDNTVEEFVYMGRGLNDKGEPCFYFDTLNTVLKNKYKQKLNV